MKQHLISLGTKISLSFLLLATPLLSFAQFKGETPEDVQGVVGGIIGFINGSLIQLAFAIALILFIWGLVQAFIIGGANEEKRNEGKQLIMWGIIAFFVMVSIWGLVKILTGTFGFTGSESVSPPQIKTEESGGSPSGTWI